MNYFCTLFSFFSHDLFKMDFHCIPIAPSTPDTCSPFLVKNLPLVRAN